MPTRTLPTSPVERRLCSVQEAARILDRSLSSVWRDIRSGALDSVHVGSSRKVTFASIDRICSGEPKQRKAPQATAAE